MDLHEEALNKIAGDMDDMESKRMYPAETKGGATITICVEPNTPEAPEAEPMSDGGVVQAPEIPDPEAEMGMPAFLRKKKGK